MDSNQELAFRNKQDEDEFVEDVAKVLQSLPRHDQDRFLQALAKVADVPVPRLA